MKQKILIVEDDEIVANIYRNKFLVEGYQVEIALDGVAGLEMVHTFRPDGVILDLMLPKMTGVEVMKKIRSEPNLQQLPVIVFSNTYLTSMVQEAWKAGATKCLSKANCSPKQIIGVLRTALGHNGASGSTTPPRHEAPDLALKPRASSQPSPASARASASDSDQEFLADLRGSFILGLPVTLAGLRALLQGIAKSENEMMRLRQLHELYRRIHTLTGHAGIAGMPQIARMAEALEALLRELSETPEKVNGSVLRTLASAIDLLGILFELGVSLGNRETPPPSVLVVDDDVISRRAVTFSLEKAKLKSVGVEDPAVAYDLLSKDTFDLIFLDVDMPGMNGFELCTKLRQLPAHRKTPVVFVTNLTDFDSRANSTISGGNDFIAKPFLFMELAVKALVCVLRGRLQSAT